MKSEKEREVSLRNSLMNRVELYFKANNISQKGNIELYIKTIFWFLTAATTYLGIIWINPFNIITYIIYFILWVIFGICLAGIGFNIAHDACHGSYSKREWLNQLLSYSFELMGTSSYFWKVKHNIAHHTYTNIDGHDDDIDAKPFLRMSPNQKRLWIHQFQAYYAPFLYGMLYFSWVWVNDFKKFFTLKIANEKIEPMNFKNKLIFLASKIWWVFVFIIFPINSRTGSVALIGSAVAIFVCGLVISIVFQPAHIVKETVFPQPAMRNGRPEIYRVTHQFQTTCDFAIKSKFWCWFLGGLGFQVEHHLLTYVSHVHYKKLNPIIQQICAEHDMKFNIINTMSGAVSSHFSLLKELGKN